MGGLYTSLGGPGMTGIAVRAVFSALFLLPPTIMMGATLPAIARWVETTPRVQAVVVKFLTNVKDRYGWTCASWSASAPPF